MKSEQDNDGCLHGEAAFPACPVIVALSVMIR